ncbi:hypothetical protein HMSSN036_23760 [Paenibacillus macerans]|nr:hypothetical protein HMSSN036_23760 [Paenibacillus macerans]
MQKITSICAGEYVAILDGDDYWTDSYKLQKQVDFLDENQNCIIAWHEITVFSEYNFFDPYTSHLYSPYKKLLSVSALILGNYLPTVSLVFRNNIIKSMPSWYYKLPMVIIL